MFTMFVGVILAFSFAQKFEAESGTLLNAAAGDTDPEVKTEAGTSYVALNEGGVIITVTVATAGVYNLKAKYRVNDPNGKKEYLAVNSVPFGEISFPLSNTFTEVVVARKLSLQANTNEIQITDSWGWVDLDYIELVPWVDTPFNINPNLVSPNPIAPAVELYNFLKARFAEKKVISGVMTLQGGDDDSLREPHWLFANTGKFPALLGLDFMHQTGKDSAWYYDDAKIFSHQIVRDASYYYGRGGIIHLMWHWRDPAKITNEFYSPSSGNTPTTFSAINAADPTKPEYQNIISDLDVVAAQLLELQNKGIAVLWRPFHEAAGKWFWWGYEGPEAVKKLWKIMFDRFTVHHGLNNLIWVWTSDGAPNGLDWYPGDEYVDIVGADIYPNAGDHNSQIGVFEQLKDLFGAKKIIALTECGSIPDPDEIVLSGAHWSFFMPWYRGYTIPEGVTPHNDIPFWQKVLGSSNILTLDGLPGWTVTVPPPPECPPPSDSALSNRLKYLYFFFCTFFLVAFI